MASIRGVKRSTDVRDVTVSTTVPSNDVARVMYYLNSVLKSCGIDIIPDDLHDFNNYHRLSQQRQDQVFLAAYKYSPDELVNKNIFVDGNGSFCTGRNANIFLETSQELKLFHAEQDVLIVGQRTRLSKIMVFKPSWLEEYYTNPMKRNFDRLRRAMESVISNHCQHCAGRAGRCVCSRCPRKSESQCSSTVRRTGIMDGFLESLNDTLQEAKNVALHHCGHCKGLHAGCGCTKGCARPKNSKCFTVHDRVPCDGCGTSQIVGMRYKCSKCENFDLCQACYKGNKHDTTHRFHRIDQMGAQWKLLEARMTEDATALAEKKGFFYEKMSITGMKQYLIENGARCNDIVEKEELCRKVWEYHCDSVSATELNKVLKDCEVDTSGCADISARRNAAKAAFRSKRGTEGMRKKGLCKDKEVVLCGLKTTDLNGMKGRVVEPVVDGRVEVVLDGSNRILRVKAENLRCDVEVVD